VDSLCYYIISLHFNHIHLMELAYTSFFFNLRLVIHSHQDYTEKIALNRFIYLVWYNCFYHTRLSVEGLISILKWHRSFGALSVLKSLATNKYMDLTVKLSLK
jgi:hypothetical protein